MSTIHFQMEQTPDGMLVASLNGRHLPWLNPAWEAESMSNGLVRWYLPVLPGHTVPEADRGYIRLLLGHAVEYTTAPPKPCPTCGRR